MFFTAGADVGYFEPFSRWLFLTYKMIRDRVDFYCFLERDARVTLNPNPADSE